MTTEDTRAQKRKIAVKLLAKIYEDDIECLAAPSRAVAVRTRAGGWSRNRQTSQSTSRDIRKGASRFLLNTN